MGLGKYFKSAFLNHWNLLAVLGGSAFAFVSGYPDVVLPLIIAGEVGYLGLLASHPRFQKYVDAQEAKTTRVQTAKSHTQALGQIRSALPRESLQRFEDLRSRCLELSKIARELKHPLASDADSPLDDLQTAGLDRLLWIYLRLLYTQFALARFLQKTGQEQIQRRIDDLEKRLAALPAGDELQKQRMRKTLEDNLQTNRDRLANWLKARDNYQLVELEIDRLENKIRSLSEMAVNRQEPEYISAQVDAVATSMMDTERTMNDLRFATGLEALEDSPPELLQPQRAKVIER